MPWAFFVRAEPFANQQPRSQLPNTPPGKSKEMSLMEQFLCPAMCVCAMQNLTKVSTGSAQGLILHCSQQEKVLLGWVSAVLANNLWAHTLHSSREQRHCIGTASQYSEAFANPAGIQEQPMGNAWCFWTLGMGCPNWAPAKFFHKKN